MRMKKVFIFDFDGTFYSGIHKFDNVRNAINTNKRKFLPNVSDDDYARICRENPKWLKAIVGDSIVKHMLSFKKKYPHLDISIRDFYNWQNNFVYDIIIDEDQLVDVSFIKELTKNYSVYVVSNSSKNHINYYMNKINIDSTWFKAVFSNEFLEEDITKEHYYKDILEIENCSNYNAYVFGDSVIADLAPALHLGINAFYVDNAKNIKSLVNSVINDEF